MHARGAFTIIIMFNNYDMNKDKTLTKNEFN